VQGAGFGVWEVQGSGSVTVQGFRVQGAGFRVQGSGFTGSGFSDQGAGSRVQASRFRGSGFMSMCRVSEC
jgi:hypothetical protein